ncbi:hypothetical protein T439DRAFT_331332 [Meredithblackwellia eburnea MCA 4105]
MYKERSLENRFCVVERRGFNLLGKEECKGRGPSPPRRVAPMVTLSLFGSQEQINKSFTLCVNEATRNATVKCATWYLLQFDCRYDGSCKGIPPIIMSVKVTPSSHHQSVSWLCAPRLDSFRHRFDDSEVPSQASSSAAVQHGTQSCENGLKLPDSANQLVKSLKSSTTFLSSKRQERDDSDTGKAEAYTWPTHQTQGTFRHRPSSSQCEVFLLCTSLMFELIKLLKARMNAKQTKNGQRRVFPGFSMSSQHLANALSTPCQHTSPHVSCGIRRFLDWLNIFEK